MVVQRNYITRKVDIAEPMFLFWDLFCGAGGTSTGIEQATMEVNVKGRLMRQKAGTVIVCANHDKFAIASHAENHPEALHFTEDIRTLDLTDAVLHTEIMRTYYPKALLALWASLECTNFSKAKGGLPRDADSRTLAEHLFRYLDEATKVGGFDYVFIENVEEFMSWGPLDERGKPISRDKGQDYLKWVSDMEAYGYQYEYRLLNAADFGAHTSRKRYFGVFAKIGMPMQFPKPTHSKKVKAKANVQHDLFATEQPLKPWKPVKEVLDFKDEGESIFGRKKPLSPKTLERIYAGLVKFIAKGDTSFIKKYYSGRPMGKVVSTDQPCPTIVANYNNLALVQASFIHKYNGRVQGANAGASVNNPLPTITTQGRMSLVNCSFLSYYYGNGYNSSLNDPSGTVTTKDRMNLIQPVFWIHRAFSGGGTAQSIDNPAGALLSNPKMDLMQVNWIMPSNYTNVGRSVDEPCSTLTADRRRHYLMFPQWGVQCAHSIENPSPVLPARMDKMCPYLVEAEHGAAAPGLVWYRPTPYALTIDDKIRMFMAIYGLCDIKMRGLRIPELKRITGFSDDYVLKGTQSDQKKFIGNAVPVLLAEAIIKSFAEAQYEPSRYKIAA